MIPDIVGLQLNEAIEELKLHNKEFRVHREGVESIITADFHPNRVEVTVDKDGNVVKVE